MKFGIISDLHMEFQPWYFEPDPDVFYLNAGDTHPDWRIRDYFHVGVLKNKVFSVKGNHDYYGDTFKGAELDFPESIWVEQKNGVTIKIAGAPLWTEIAPNRWNDFVWYMMDSRQIRDLTYDRYMNTHQIQKNYLFNSGADIWVVHHLPSFKSVHPKFQHSDGNDFFASELAPQILDMKNPPKLIVHGHTHERMDYMIGNTRVVCNPRGYPNEQSWYKNYEPLIVEIEI